MLRQLALRARSAAAVGSSQWTLPSIVAESQQLTTLLSFRGFTAGTSHLWQAESSPEVARTGPAPVPNNPPPPAWTTTRELVKRKTLPKRMGHLLQVLENEKQEAAMAELQRPDFRPGDLIELKLSVPENKRRTTVFKGICIAKRNRGWRSSFTLRNFIGNSGGIERTFPL